MDQNAFERRIAVKLAGNKALTNREKQFLIKSMESTLVKMESNLEQMRSFISRLEIGDSQALVERQLESVRNELSTCRETLKVASGGLNPKRGKPVPESNATRIEASGRPE